MKLAYPAFAVAKANAKGKCCERRRRSRAQCLSACTGVVDLLSKQTRVIACSNELQYEIACQAREMVEEAEKIER